MMSWKPRQESVERPYTIRTGHHRQSETLKKTTEIIKKCSAKKKRDNSHCFQRSSSIKKIGQGHILLSPFDIMTEEAEAKLETKFEKEEVKVEKAKEKAVVPANYKSILGGVDYHTPFFPAACTISLCPSCRDLECKMRNDGEVISVSYKEPSTPLIKTIQGGGVTQSKNPLKEPTSKNYTKCESLPMANAGQVLSQPDKLLKTPQSYSQGHPLPTKLSFQHNDFTKQTSSDVKTFQIDGTPTRLDLKDTSPIDTTSTNNNKPMWSTDPGNPQLMRQRSLSASRRGPYGKDIHTSGVTPAKFNKYAIKVSESAESNSTAEFKKSANPNSRLQRNESETINPYGRLRRNERASRHPHGSMERNESASRGTENGRHSRRDFYKASGSRRSRSIDNKHGAKKQTRSPSPGTRRSQSPGQYQKLSTGQNVIIQYNNEPAPANHSIMRKSDQGPNSPANKRLSFNKNETPQPMHPYNPNWMPTELIPKDQLNDKEHNTEATQHTRKTSRQSQVLLGTKTDPAIEWNRDSAFRESMIGVPNQTRRGSRTGEQYQNLRECERDTERECIRTKIAQDPKRMVKDIRLECLREGEEKCKGMQMQNCLRNSVTGTTTAPLVRNCLDIDGRLCHVGSAQEMKMLSNYYEKKKKNQFWQDAISVVFNNIIFTAEVVIVGALIFFLTCFLQDVNHFFQMAVVFLIMTVVYMLVCQPFSKVP